MRALVSWQMPRRSLRAYLPKATNVVDEGASIACDVTAVVIGSCPLGGGLGRRVSGAEWIARDPTWVVRRNRKDEGSSGSKQLLATTRMNGRLKPS